MNVTHLACVKSARKNAGVAAQMLAEAHSARELNISWDVQLWSSDKKEDGICYTLGGWSNNFFIRRFLFYRQIKKALQNSDTVLVRYMPLDIFSLLLSQREKKKILFVYHTARSNYLQNIVLVGPLISILDNFIQSFMKERIHGIVAVTSQILDLEIENVKSYLNIQAVYPNALNLSYNDARLHDARKDKIKIAFIASQFFYWNGLELLLNSCSDNDAEDVEIILVGRLTSPTQQKLVRQRSKLISHYNFMTSSELSDLYTRVDLTLAAFRLDEVGLTEACTLKVRESFLHGVAVYSGHKDTVLSGNAFYFEGQADISRIYNVAKAMRLQKKFCVLESAVPLIDKNYYVAELFEGLTKSVRSPQIQNEELHRS